MNFIDRLNDEIDKIMESIPEEEEENTIAEMVKQKTPKEAADDLAYLCVTMYNNLRGKFSRKQIIEIIMRVLEH